MKIVKKIILYLFLLLILLIAVFFVIGILNPSYAYQTSVEVNKPRDQAWTLFMDESKTGEWLEGFKSFETVSGAPGKEGSVFRLTIVQEGKEFVMTETNTTVREPEQYSFKLDNDVLTNLVDIRLAESGGKTTITSNENVTGKNIFWKSLFFWFHSTFKNGSQENLNNLKRYMEKQP
jgi:carbon monoxide dehydrogenase subunit G